MSQLIGRVIEFFEHGKKVAEISVADLKKFSFIGLKTFWQIQEKEGRTWWTEM